MSDEEGLVASSLELLAGNWDGRSTRASRSLYPHQWSWDSACIALALAHYDQARAQRELASVFAGQWRNGMLPHIRFFHPGNAYFPGPEVWDTGRSKDAVASPLTSGIVQPPVHATALAHLVTYGSDHREAVRFSRELYDSMLAWHTYLHTERVRAGSQLVEIWHPWESGMDNSPLWDVALARIEPPCDLEDYRRVDVTLADERERPTSWEYDRYVYLVALERALDYEPGAIRATTPFAIRDVLFNSLLVRADRDLAEVARAIGADDAPCERWADGLAAAIEHEMWDDARGIYRDIDVIGAAPVGAVTAAGLAPLFAAVPDPARATRLRDSLRRFECLLPTGETVLASVEPDDPAFDPRRYWRGPVWPMLTWVVSAGLRGYSWDDDAGRLDRGLLRLVGSNGPWEHFDPLTGRGQGSAGVSWTAALALEMLVDHAGNGAT